MLGLGRMSLRISPRLMTPQRMRSVSEFNESGESRGRAACVGMVGAPGAPHPVRVTHSARVRVSRRYPLEPRITVLLAPAIRVPIPTSAREAEMNIPSILCYETTSVSASGRCVYEMSYHRKDVIGMRFGELDKDKKSQIRSLESPEKILAALQAEGVELTDGQLELVSGGYQTNWIGEYICPRCGGSNAYRYRISSGTDGNL